MGRRRLAQVASGGNSHRWLATAITTTKRHCRNGQRRGGVRQTTTKKKTTTLITGTTAKMARIKTKKVKYDYEEKEIEEDMEDEKEYGRRKSRKKKEIEEEEERSVEDEEDEKEYVTRKSRKKKEDEEDEEEEMEYAKALGEVIRISGKGRWRRSHYNEFEYNGSRYELDDPVLLVPEGEYQKPYIAIIKDISVDHRGKMNVMAQWFYRPEEAEKLGGGHWQSQDLRELFYSFHRDEVPAESVMHKCEVHFIPLNKQIPCRKARPGFVVQKVYCPEQGWLFELTDEDYGDEEQEEIDLLVQKTMSRLGDLPDIEHDDGDVDHEDQLIDERIIRESNYMTPLDVSRQEEGVFKSAQSLKAETLGSCLSTASEYCAILFEFNALTGDSHRDKWLEKLFQVIHAVYTSADDLRNPDTSSSAEPGNAPEDKVEDVVSFCWPDGVVASVASLENATHEFFMFDYQKYNQKMRQLTYNLKPNALLSRRLLNGELEPLQILNMTPYELKEGLTAEEMESRVPEDN